MAHVRKMMLEPDTTHLTMSTLPTSSIQGNIKPMPASQNPEKQLMQRTMRDLDGDTQDILNNPNLQEDEKLKLYTQVLQCRLTFTGKLATPHLILVQHSQETKQSTSMENDKMARDIVSSFPVTLQGKARRIVQAFKSSPDVIGWDKD